MSGIVMLSKVQMGRETTAGTAVPATLLFRGYGIMDDQREVMFPEERIGIFSGVDRSYIPRYMAAMSFQPNESTFEMLPHVLEAGIQTVTPAQDGSGSGYIYTYDLPETAAPTIQPYTLEGGDNQQAEEMEYSFVNNFTLAGNAGEAWMLSSEWLGRQVTNTTFTPGLSVPDVSDMLFQKTKIYIDDVDGSFGGTQKTMTLLSASLAYTTGLIPKFTADGHLYFSFVQTTAPEALLTLTFEHDATAVAEKTNWRNQTARLIRLLCEGDALTTTGSAYSAKTMIIDLAGKWESFDPLGDQDGNMISQATFRGRYNATAAEFGKIIIVNELSSLP